MKSQMNNIESVLANMANTVAILASQRQTSESSVANSDNSLNTFTPIKSSTGSLSSYTSKIAKKITLEEQIGVAIDPELIRSEIFAAGYALNDKCQGYCKDELMRKVAIIAALDTVTVKGASGTDLFNDFDIFG